MDACDSRKDSTALDLLFRQIPDTNSRVRSGRFSGTRVTQKSAEVRKLAF